MGYYTGLRFKGIVKEAFRDDFECAGLFGEWEKLQDTKLNSFSHVLRSSFIPCGALSYMPSDWEEDYIDEEGKRMPMFEHQKHLPEKEIFFWMQVATDGFERHYNPDTGYWAFQCSLKNYAGTIEQFAALVPYFIESLEHFEVKCEDEPSCYYTLENLKTYDHSTGRPLTSVCAI